MTAGRRLTRDNGGAVAPTVALSLFALIAVGGIAFDYSRLAAMDSELQNAADQAALAAASQLDGKAGACARAAAAARSLLTNATLMANDGESTAIVVPDEPACDASGSIQFYQSYNSATDMPGDEATGDSDAKVVRIAVESRQAFYALTPVVAAVSGQAGAQAVAGLHSAVCNIPALMICTQPGVPFPAAADVGKGLRIQPGPKVGAWVPGDYGYLDFGNGASGLNTNLASNTDASGCHESTNGIDTEPGNKASVTDGLNTRLDLYASGQAACNSSTGDNCPAENNRKDLVKTEEVEVAVKPTDPQPANPGCGAAGHTIIDTSNATDTNGFVQGSVAKGYPRDDCHITGSCNGGNFGDGVWDKDAYFTALHPSTSATAVAATLGKTKAQLTRFDVYKWELLDKPNRLSVKSTDVTPSPVPFKDTGGSGPNAKRTYTFTNKCAYPQAKNGTAVPATATQKDRRILTIAAVDCTGLNGKGSVNIQNLVDVFLVEASLDRTVPYATGKSQIYAEIASGPKKPDGSDAFQFYLRQRPRLLR